MRWTKAGWVSALITLVVGVVLLLRPKADGLALFSFDLLAVDPRGGTRPESVPEEVVVVYMDDLSREALQQPVEGWDRGLHARLLSRLRSAGANLVVLDVVFGQPGRDSAADAALAQAIKEHGRVVLAADFSRADVEGTTRQLSSSLDLPIPEFRSAAAGWGLVNLPLDQDFGVRRMLPPQHPETPGLAWATARLLGAKVTEDTHWVSRWLHYYGPPGTLRSVRYSQALEPDGVSADFFTNKVVFVGAKQSTGFWGKGKDEFATPYTRFTGTFSPGVEIQATALLNLMRGDWMVRFPLGLECLLVGLVGLGFGLGLTSMGRGSDSQVRVVAAALAPTWVAAAGLIVVPVLAWGVCRLTGAWCAWVIWEVQILVALLCALTANSVRAFVERRTAQFRAEVLQLQSDKLKLEHDKLTAEKETLERSLSLHLSPARVKQLLAKPELLRPGTERMQVTIMFSDIAVYSKMAETLESDDLVRLLNNYYETALGCVHQTDGTVLQLLGDAIYAIWNAPIAQTDHSERACRTALLLADRLDNYGVSQGSMPFRTRIGLHAGLANVGNIGSTRQFCYVAVGENVNLASRLEGLNKHLGTQILATRDLVRQLGESVLVRKSGFFRLKGFGRLTEIYEIVGLLPAYDPAKAWVRTFEEGLQFFCARQFDDAESAFRRVVEARLQMEDQQRLSPEFRIQDGPSVFYLKRIDEFRQQPPPPDWVGEIALDQK